MAYAAPRSVNSELHIGVHEGSYNISGKDWGGPQDARTRIPCPDNDDEAVLRPPGENR